MTFRCPACSHLAPIEEYLDAGIIETGADEYAALVTCRACGSTRALCTWRDGSKCDGCDRVVTGCAPDVKVVTMLGVLCVECGQRSALVPRAA